MDKRLIINKLSTHYTNGNDADFARLLGITPQNLSNWKKRNSLDIELIYTKCVDLSPEWLLTGQGPMLKSEIKNNDPPDCSQYKEEITQLLKEVSELKSQIIRLQAEQLHFKKVPEPKPKQPATQLKTHTK